METLINYQSMKLFTQDHTDGGKYNTVWGTDYLLMDSSSFLGGADGSRYDTIIDMMTKIRTVRGE